MWRELFDREPPSLGRRYLEDRLAYRCRNCTTAGCPIGRGASSTPWSTSSSPKPPAGAIPGARSPAPGWCASGRAPSTWSPCASMTSSTAAGRTSRCRRLRERSPMSGGTAGRSLAYARNGTSQMNALPRKIRCAIYCRKSSRRGLWPGVQLAWMPSVKHALSYIVSQASRGLDSLDDHYEDGGDTGGTLQRPSLRRLIRDIEAGRIEAVICYGLTD